MSNILSFPPKTNNSLKLCDSKIKRATECTFVPMCTQPITLSNTKLNYTTKRTYINTISNTMEGFL